MYPSIPCHLVFELKSGTKSGCQDYKTSACWEATHQFYSFYVLFCFSFVLVMCLLFTFEDRKAMNSDRYCSFGTVHPYCSSVKKKKFEIDHRCLTVVRFVHVKPLFLF